MDAGQELADRFDERARLHSSDGGRGKERVEEVIVVWGDESDVVLFRIEGFEETNGCPTTSDNDESLFTGKLLAQLVLLIFRIRAKDGEILGPTSFRFECQRAQGNLVDVGFTVSESIVSKDDGGGSNETKDYGADRVSCPSKSFADDAAFPGYGLE